MTTQDNAPAHTSLPWSCYRSENPGVGWLIQGKNTIAEPLDHVHDPASGQRDPVYQHLVIGEMDDLPEAQANAEFIVRACNAHDELLEALEEVTESLASFYEIDRVTAGQHFGAALKERMTIALAKAHG